MTTVPVEVKQIDLGNGGAGFPGTLVKLNRLDMFPTKQNPA